MFLLIDVIVFGVLVPVDVLKLPNRDFKIYNNGDVDQNVTSKYKLHNLKSFAIISTRSSRKIWAKYPKNKLGTSGFRLNPESERFKCGRVFTLSSKPQIW